MPSSSPAFPLSLPEGERPGLAVALGGAGLTLHQLVTLYGALAADGRVRPLRTLRSEREAGSRPLLTAATARTVAAILRDAPPPRGKPPARLLAGAPRIAAKTGTSFGFRDSWAIGVDGRYAVGVWVGRVDGTPRPGRTGRDDALPLLHAVFGLLPRDPARELPSPDTALEEPAPLALHNFEDFGRYVLRSVLQLAIDFPPDGATIELSRPRRLPEDAVESHGRRENTLDGEWTAAGRFDLATGRAGPGQNHRAGCRGATRELRNLAGIDPRRREPTLPTRPSPYPAPRTQATSGRTAWQDPVGRAVHRESFCRPLGRTSGPAHSTGGLGQPPQSRTAREPNPPSQTTYHGSEPSDHSRDATDQTQCGCRPHGQSRARSYNTVHPKVSLGYLPPAPETVDPPSWSPGSAPPGAPDGRKPAMHKHLNRTDQGGQVRPRWLAGVAETAGGRVGRPLGNGVLHLAVPCPIVEDHRVDSQRHTRVEEEGVKRSLSSFRRGFPVLGFFLVLTCMTPAPVSQGQEARDGTAAMAGQWAQRLVGSLLRHGGTRGAKLALQPLDPTDFAGLDARQRRRLHGRMLQALADEALGRYDLVDRASLADVARALEDSPDPRWHETYLQVLKKAHARINIVCRGTPGTVSITVDCRATDLRDSRSLAVSSAVFDLAWLRQPIALDLAVGSIAKDIASRIGSSGRLAGLRIVDGRTGKATGLSRYVANALEHSIDRHMRLHRGAVGRAEFRVDGEILEAGSGRERLLLNVRLFSGDERLQLFQEHGGAKLGGSGRGFNPVRGMRHGWGGCEPASACGVYRSGTGGSWPRIV